MSVNATSFAVVCQAVYYDFYFIVWQKEKPARKKLKEKSWPTKQGYISFVHFNFEK